MSRTTKGPASHGRRKAILKKAKGYCRGRNNRLKIAKETIMRALRYAKRDRRVRKRDMRGLWIQRIGAATQALGLSYSRFMFGLKQAHVELNRKTLAYLAVSDSETMATLVNLANEEIAKGNGAATNREAA
jgi:large subunit ribosomal protein L20